MGVFKEIFAWWTGNTIGTRFFTWRKGTFVGEDEFGNRYYRANVPPLGERRWVIYAAGRDWDPSQIPPGWYGWMHHTIQTPPVDEDYRPREWQKPHKANMTGTPAAYRPKGSVLRPSHRPRATGDYEAWTPGN